MMEPRKSAGGEWTSQEGGRSPGGTRLDQRAPPHFSAALTTESVAATSSSPKIDPIRA